MRVFEYLKTIKSPELRLAWLVAIAVDAIQIGALPLFVAGGLSPADAILDAVAAIMLIQLLGWHWAFLPTLAAELRATRRRFARDLAPIKVNLGSHRLIRRTNQLAVGRRQAHE